MGTVSQIRAGARRPGATLAAIVLTMLAGCDSLVSPTVTLATPEIALVGADSAAMVGQVDTVRLVVRQDGELLTGVRLRWGAADSSAVSVRSLATAGALPPSPTFQDSLHVAMSAEVTYLKRGLHTLVVRLDSVNAPGVRVGTVDVRAAERWHAVSAAKEHTCAVTTRSSTPEGSQARLRSGGVAYCWGDGRFGALGTGVADQQNAPVPVATVERFQEVEAGNEYTCGQDVFGLLYCWGDNFYGQLGLGNRLNQAVPRLIALAEGYASFGVGDDKQFTCAIRSKVGQGSGETLCWGDNRRGELGCAYLAADLAFLSQCDSTGLTVPNTEIPLSVRNASGEAILFSGISLGSGHACGLASGSTFHPDGTALCWGLNRRFELGSDTTGLRFSDAARPVEGYRFAEVVAGGRFRLFKQPSGFSCGIDEDRRGVRCWGWMPGAASSAVSLTPVPVEGLPDSELHGLTAGTAHACVLTAEGLAYCWGRNNEGQLGDGTLDRRPSAAPVSGARSFDVVSAGEAHTCGVARVRLDESPSSIQGGQGGEVLCWGDNRLGQLGDGTTERRTTPVPVQEPGSG